MTAQALPGVTTGRTVTPRRILKQAGKGREIQIPVTLSGSASYDGANTSYEKYIRGGCFLAVSSGVWAPVKRTKANAAGSSSTSLVVDNATHFKAGDSIVIGYQTAQAIVSIDYSTNTITLTSAATWLDNDPVYVAAYGTARAMLLDDEVSLWNPDKSANVNKTAQALLSGYIDQDKVLGDITAILEHPESAIYLKNFFFDDYQDATDSLPGNFRWKQVFLSGNKTLVAGDTGTEFICNAAVTVTLPALASAGEGFRIRVRQIADANLTVTAPSGKLIAFNNAAATSVAASTSGEKIGAGFEIALLPDATKFIANTAHAGANTTTVA